MSNSLDFSTLSSTPHFCINNKLFKSISYVIQCQAHNLKVVGSNPTPATTETDTPEPARPEVFAFWAFFAALPSLLLRASQSRMVPSSPCSVASIWPRLRPGVSVTRSIRPRMASAASCRSSGRLRRRPDAQPCGGKSRQRSEGCWGVSRLHAQGAAAAPPALPQAGACRRPLPRGER